MWSNLACKCVLISAISSRKIVPLLASSNFPGLLRTAPVKAPCSNPNSSDSSNSPESGVGKEVVARMIHLRPKRRNHPLLAQMDHPRAHLLAYVAFSTDQHPHRHRRHV